MQENKVISFRHSAVYSDVFDPPFRKWIHTKKMHVRSSPKKSNNIAQIKRIDQIRAILKSYQSTRSLKQTARQLQISKNIVKSYIRRAQAFSGDLEELLFEIGIIYFYPPNNMSSPHCFSMFYYSISPALLSFDSNIVA